MKIMKISLLALLVSVGFSSCSDEAKDENVENIIDAENAIDTTKTVVVEDADLNKELQFKLDLIIGNNINGPSKIIADIKSKEMGRYINGTTVNLEGREFDGTTISKGLLLGALGVDVTYLSVYDRPDLGLKYLAHINKLDQALDCGMQIDAKTIEAFEAVKEDGDKISELMYEQYFKMEGHLKSNARLETAAHIMVGGIVESMFIATAQLREGDFTPEAAELVYAQKSAINDLIGVYSELEQTDGNEAILEELKAIQALLVKGSAEFTKEDLSLLHEVVEAFHTEIAEEGIL